MCKKISTAQRRDMGKPGNRSQSPDANPCKARKQHPYPSLVCWLRQADTKLEDLRSALQSASREALEKKLRMEQKKAETQIQQLHDDLEHEKAARVEVERLVRTSEEARKSFFQQSPLDTRNAEKKSTV
ncbi:unnamed protein product [Symbiodinium natans]|uniref:Uncharacterized protein n=1 Tax=Symbiodinium natans TaxID=878477 RepID=A0A812UUX0_9DINO|nr:unnamed protein product [Symbiodinium natans]